TEFTISLYEKSNSQIDYEICSHLENEEIIHSQGTSHINNLSAPDNKDIEELKGQMRLVELGVVNPEIINIYQGENQLLAQ
ncbi:hypothetical protein J9332_44405, partial [Aquimarina celericrescens]|nr:hypothetical protein [Aquimarina celericrescens]